MLVVVRVAIEIVIQEKVGEISDIRILMGTDTALIYNIPGYYKINRHFQCCIEMKLLMI